MQARGNFEVVGMRCTDTIGRNAARRLNVPQCPTTYNTRGCHDRSMRLDSMHACPSVRARRTGLSPGLGPDFGL
jgi:hypothetical protein